jgi:hypothetical protein
MEDRSCQKCGQSFKPAAPASRYCQESCRKQAANTRRKATRQALKHCRSCRKPATIKYKGIKASFCSPDCAIAWLKRRCSGRSADQLPSSWRKLILTLAGRTVDLGR